MTVTVLNGQQTKLTGLPDRWEETRMKAAVGRYQLKKNADPKPVVLSLTKTGVRVKTDLAFGKSTENYVGHQIVQPGQFVFTPRDFDATPILCGISPTMGCISNLYLVFDVSQDFNPRFLEYYFWGLKWGYDYFAQLSYGMRYSFNQETFERIPLAKPTIVEQDAVVRFLDREICLIDGLIEKKTRFITLLMEKRAAVITHAVTKGTDPEAPMRESGVNWLGRVPTHWEVLRIAALFREVSRPADPALPVLSVSIHDGVTDGELADEDRDRKVALSEDRTKYQGVAPGDLVYNMMRAWQGAFGAVTVKGLVSPAYVVAAPVTQFRTKFIEHLLHTKSAAEEIRRFSRGIADFRMRLYWDHFRALMVCLPPLDEQDRILSRIDAEIARIDGLITLTQRSIDLLREKRAALITAAVTGKIDVRAVA